MAEPENAMPTSTCAGFREVVRHPRAHALVLQQYRIGEYAGVVGLKRLLGEMQPEGKLHRAMEIHYRDEDRHSRVFTDWIYRLGVEPEPMPDEGRGLLLEQPGGVPRATASCSSSCRPTLRRIVTFAAINAHRATRLQPVRDAPARALDRREDIETLESVMARRSST